jgi:DNA-directed RNA polymerase specialized sigma24 family protein
VLILLVWEDLSQEEAAHVLGVSVNAVALRSSRARKRLGEELKRLGFSSTDQDADRRIHHPEEPTEVPT